MLDHDSHVSELQILVPWGFVGGSQCLGELGMLSCVVPGITCTPEN